ncbi:MAG: zinc ribbon domain-containing protein [Acidobacteriota bacterium]
MNRLAALPVKVARALRITLAVVATAVLLAILPAPRTLADQAEDGVALTEVDRRAGAGERCIVCQQQIHGDEIVEVRYKGRTFHVAGKMLEQLASDTDTYFQELQARSALFDERAVEGRQVSTGWLWFGSYVLIGLVFSAICGYLAIGRSLEPLPWFFAGLVGNLPALLVLLAAGRGDSEALPAGLPAGLAKVPTTRAPVRCAECGAQNHPAATACASCGHILSPTVEAETARI